VRLGKAHAGFIEVTSMLAVGGAPHQSVRAFAAGKSAARDLPPFYAEAGEVERSTRPVTATQ